MDSALWKVNGTSTAELRLSGFEVALANQSVDRLGFHAPGRAFDSVSLYNYKDPISLTKAGVRWFAGVVLAGPRFGSPSLESHDYEVAGPWWYLEQLVFEQEWRAGTGSLVKSHVLLGRDINNATVSVGVVIKEVLDHVIAAGAPLAYDQAELDLLTAVPPTDEQTDIACSEAIQKMLRWMPDVETWFDYAPATPVLHLTRRMAAAAVQYDCTAGKPTEQIGITRRDDLVQSGVILNYERVDTIDGEQILALHPDTYPAGTIPGFDTASFTIRINGLQLATQSVAVVVRAPDLSIITDLRPELADAVLTMPQMTGGLPYVLVSGSVPDWTGKVTGKGQILALATYTDQDGTVHTDEKVSASVNLTDADTHLYTREISYTPADPIPVGLAQALFEAVSVVHFQGEYALLESECMGGIHPGMVLNLSGGLVEWATMRAAIQRVVYNLDAGRTSITFGPPEHLSPQDHIALLNANRLRITAFSADARSTGVASAEEIETGGGTADSSGAGGLRLSKLVMKDSTKTKTIEIDAAQMGKGKVLVGVSDTEAKLDYLKWR